MSQQPRRADHADREDPTDRLEIRLLKPEDAISDVTLLVNRAYKRLADLGLRYVATWQGDDITLKRVRDAECYVGLLDGRLVATLVFRAAGRTRGCPWYDRPDVSSFGQFGVEPELQGRGIGSAMLAHAENRAKETGAKEIACDTAEPAAHLIKWYRNRGYRFVEYARWDVTNYRSVILSKKLD